MRVARAVVLPMLIACLTVGCEDDPTIVDRTDEPDGPQPYPETTTPDVLVANLMRSYNERNYAEYEVVLHPEFLFYLAPEDVAAGADVVFSRARDLEATYNMFIGLPGQTPDGGVQPPLRAISLRLTPETPDWTDVVGQDFQGTVMRRYEVDMTIEYVGALASAVVGLQEFYAAPVERDEGDGTVTTVYQLRFWRDLGHEGLKTESETWGRIKSMY